jgi:hypothetical protein
LICVLHIDSEDAMPITSGDVAKFLDEQARLGEPITYTHVIVHFPDLPKLTEAWLSHPLCEIFGMPDEQDHAEGRPFRRTSSIRNSSGEVLFGHYLCVDVSSTAIA